MGRRLIFWTHLTVGSIIGLLVLNASVTGLLLSFEPQIVDFAERNVRLVAPPPESPQKLGPQAILESARAAAGGANPVSLMVRSDPTATASVGFGKEVGLWYVDPYSGKVLGKGSKIHETMHAIEDWHRWLWSKEAGRVYTAAAAASLLFMVLSGVILWWARKVSGFKPGLTGKAWNWNRHSTVGIWAAPMLLVTALTGMLMAYPWATDLLFKLAGDKPPARAQKSTEAGKEGTPITPGNLDALLSRAQAKVPGWMAITLRFPRKEGAPVIASIEEPAPYGPRRRSQLSLDPATAEPVKWEPYSGQSKGKRWRSWVVPLHTGQAWGLPGQTVAALAAAGAAVLVWTGLAMALSRLIFACQRRKTGIE